jgi:hypothetical protein
MRLWGLAFVHSVELGWYATLKQFLQAPLLDTTVNDQQLAQVCTQIVYCLGWNRVNAYNGVRLCRVWGTINHVCLAQWIDEHTMTVHRFLPLLHRVRRTDALRKCPADGNDTATPAPMWELVEDEVA